MREKQAHQDDENKKKYRKYNAQTRILHNYRGSTKYQSMSSI